MGFACVTGRAGALAAIRHPLVLIALAIAAWSTAMAPAARYPLLSVTGSPQIADGVVLWLDTAVFIAAARLIRHSRKALEAAGFAALFGAIALPALAVIPATRGIWFNDYLAFLGIAAAVAVPFSLQRIASTPRARISLALLAGLPALAASQNMTAVFGLAVIAFPLFAAMLYLTRPTRDFPAGRVRTLAAIAVGGIALAIPVGIYWIGADAPVISIRSRALIFDVLFDFIDRYPATLLTGKGWGHTEQYFAESLANANVTIWDRSWDAAWRDIFHSHNMVLEALISAGLPAAVGVLAFLVALPLCCPAGKIPVATAYAAGYGCIAAFWFEMPGTVPFTAFAVALLTRMPTGVPGGRAARVSGAAVLGLIAATQLSAVAVLSAYVWKSYRVETMLTSARATAPDRYGPAECDMFPREEWRGDTGLALQLVRAFNTILFPPGGRPPTAADGARLDYFACAATRRSAESGSRALLRAGLLFRAQLAFDSKFAPFRNRLVRYLDDWEPLARHYLRLEPERADLIYPYLSWLLSGKQYDPALSLADAILAGDGGNAIGLWFKGLSLLQQGRPRDRAEALRLLRAGLDRGVEKWFRIPEHLKDAVRAATPDRGANR